MQFKETSNFTIMDRKTPQLFREQFPYSGIPHILFDGVTVPIDFPEQIWITDTTFRDGQQARPPYSVQQISDIYELMHQLSGPEGVIRQTEFFLYSKRDRKAVDACLTKNHRWPEITGWIRANIEDFQIVKEIGLKETGILTSVSDYHIYLKMKKTRAVVMEMYLDVVRESLNQGIIPRCHFEDITRADFYGFVLPFAQELLKLSKEAKIPVKIRLCDTMGFGLSYPGTVLPRSIPRMIHALRQEIGYPSEYLEWHGHNDFHKVHTNASNAWLYGVSSLNASILGFGERTGNQALEGAVMEYIGLTGSANGMDLKVINKIADYYRSEVKANIPKNYPFVGEDFNTTRAGIHADGLLKNEEIYNIFDTKTLLDRPLKVMVTDKSGMAGIAHWINDNVPSISEGHTDKMSKRHPGIKQINTWVDEQYQQGRITSISPEELLAQARHFIPRLFESNFAKAIKMAKYFAQKIAVNVTERLSVENLREEEVARFLDDVLKKEPSIQFAAITDPFGKRIGQVHTQRGEGSLFRNVLKKNFTGREWLVKVAETKEPWYSDLYFSKFTGRLILTAAQPIVNGKENIYAVLDLDFMFDELVKLESEVAEELFDSSFSY